LKRDITLSHIINRKSCDPVTVACGDKHNFITTRRKYSK